MRLTRVRFTVRRMMFAVLLTALALVACRFLLEVWAAFDDTYYFSSRELTRSGTLARRPESSLTSLKAGSASSRPRTTRLRSGSVP